MSNENYQQIKRDAVVVNEKSYVTTQDWSFLRTKKVQKEKSKINSHKIMWEEFIMCVY